MTQIQSPTSQLAIISLSPAVQPSRANHLTTHHYPCTHPLSIYSSTPSPLSHYPPMQSPPTHRHPSHSSTLAAVHPHNHPPSSKGSPLSLDRSFTFHSPQLPSSAFHHPPGCHPFPFLPANLQPPLPKLLFPAPLGIDEALIDVVKCSPTEPHPPAAQAIDRALSSAPPSSLPPSHLSMLNTPSIHHADRQGSGRQCPSGTRRPGLSVFCLLYSSSTRSTCC